MSVDFFIRRPIFATVCALMIILAGAVCIPTLPIAQFPALAPPQVTVFSNYIGASAQVVESAVTIPLEQQINGAEGLKYVTSSSGNDGTSQIVATFDLGRDPDLAAVDIQNRVNIQLVPAVFMKSHRQGCRNSRTRRRDYFAVVPSSIGDYLRLIPPVTS